MQFRSLTLSPDTMIVEATAEGHADDVVKVFREVCRLIFLNQGAWRFTIIQGQCFPEMYLDSEMTWSLRAERKVDHQLRERQGTIS